MYLYRKTYIKNRGHLGNPWKITIEYEGLPVSPAQIDPQKAVYITEEVAYWRKANHIHRWFVENVQEGRDECQFSYVSASNLRELLGLVRQVLHEHNPVKAEELLPCQLGFFFGGINYDIYYWESLQETLKMLSPLVDEESEGPGFDGFEYHASW